MAAWLRMNSSATPWKSQRPGDDESQGKNNKGEFSQPGCLEIKFSARTKLTGPPCGRIELPAKPRFQRYEVYFRSLQTKFDFGNGWVTTKRVNIHQGLWFNHHGQEHRQDWGYRSRCPVKDIHCPGIVEMRVGAVIQGMRARAQDQILPAVRIQVAAAE